MRPAVARLQESRDRAVRTRAASRQLCERAGAGVRHARELRVLSADQAQSWRDWHRLWHRVVPGRATLGRPGARALVRVCMYCARVHRALPLARGVDEADRAWSAVPGWVRDRLGHPALGVIPSHGMCPSCARRHENDG